jgi:hypothetical protein
VKAKQTVTLEHNPKVGQFEPSVMVSPTLVSSTMQVSVGDQIRATAGFREGKNVFKNNDIAEVREITDTEPSYVTTGECALMMRASNKASA